MASLTVRKRILTSTPLYYMQREDNFLYLAGPNNFEKIVCQQGCTQQTTKISELKYR
jgi:hypothetical protein